jgi:hypothetical protein
MEQPKKELYKKLNASGDYTKSYEEFETQFSTPEKQTALYQKLNSNGRYTKSQDEFVSRFFSAEPVKKKETTESSSTLPAKSSVSPLAKTSLDISENPLEFNNVVGQLPTAKNTQDKAPVIAQEKYKLAGSPQVLPRKQDVGYDLLPNRPDVVRTKPLPKTPSTVIASKTKEIDNMLMESALSKINAVDESLAQQRLEDTKNDTQAIDYLREGAKKVVGGIVNPLYRAIFDWDSERKEGDYKPEIIDTLPFQPLEKEKAEVRAMFSNRTIPPAELQQLAEKKFIENDLKAQRKSNADAFFSDDNTDAQFLLEYDALKKIAKKQPELSANILEIQLIEKKHETLSNQIAEDEKVISQAITDKTQLDPAFIENYKAKVTESNSARERYLSLLDDTEKVGTELQSVSENLELFKLNYNPYDKFIYGVGSSIQRLGGGALGALAEITPNATLAKDIRTDGRNLVKDAEETMKGFRRIAVDDIQGASDLGKYTANLFAEQLPVLGSMAVGGYVGLGFLGASSGGEKMMEMRKEMELSPSKYSNLEVKLTGLAFGLAEAIPELNTFNMLKGAKKSIQAIGRSEVERTLFNQGMKGVVKQVMLQSGKTLAEATKEGLSENLTGILQDYVDQNILGNYVPGQDDKRKEEFFSGFIMGGGMALVKNIPPVYGYIASQVANNKQMFEVKNDLKHISALEAELNKENLTDNDKKIINDDINALNAKIEQTITSTVSNAENMSKNKLEAIISLSKEQANYRYEAEEIKNGNLSNEIKKAKLGQLKAQFNEAESNRQGIINGTITDDNLAFIQEKKAKQNETKPETPTITETQPQAEVSQQAQKQKVEQKNGTIYVTDEKGITKGFATKEEAVEKLRADEQIELKSVLPNAELNAEGKIDYQKLSLTDSVTYGDIYAKYDELITPLLENTEPQQMESDKVDEDVFNTVKKYSLSDKNNKPPLISINDIDLGKSGLSENDGGFPAEVNKVELLEIRGKNNEGLTVGTVIIEGGSIENDTYFKEKFEVFFKPKKVNAEADVVAPSVAKPTINIKDRFDTAINIDDIGEGFVLHRGSNIDSPLGFNSLDKNGGENYAKGGEMLISSKIKKDAKILKLVKGDTENYQDNTTDIDEFFKIIGEEERLVRSEWTGDEGFSDITTRLWNNKKIIDKLKKAGIDIVIGNTIDGVDAVVINENAVEKYVENEKTQTSNTSNNFKLGGTEEFHHASSSKRNGRLKPNNAPQFGVGVYFSTNKELVEDEYGKENTTTVKLNIQKPVYTNTKEWNKVEELAVENAIANYNKKNNLLEDERGYKNNWEISEIPSKFISDAAKELGYDAIIDEGSSQYENEIIVLDESKIIYSEDAKQERGNTSIDTNVQPGNNTNIPQQENQAVQSSANIGESKDNVEVTIDDVAEFLKITFPNNNQKNESTKSTTGQSDQGAKNDSVSKDSEVDSGQKEKVKSKKRGNRVPLDQRQIKDPVMLAALKAEPASATDIVQQHIIGGGRLTPDVLKEAIASNNKTSDARAKISYIRTSANGGLSFWTTIDQLLSDTEEIGSTEDDLREALIDVIKNFNTPKAMALDFVKRNSILEENKDGQPVNTSGEVLLETPYGYMTEREIADMQQYEIENELQNLDENKAQEALSALDLLSDLEIIELANAQQTSYDDFIKNLEERRVTFDAGPFEEVGTLQSDGSIIGDSGEVFPKSDVSNVQQVNPKPKKELIVKKPIEVTNKDVKKSNRKIRDEKVDKKLDDAFKDLRDELGKLMTGVNPNALIKASKIIAIYTESGVYKLSDIIEDAYEKFGELSKEMFDAIKQGYASFRETADNDTYAKLDVNTRDFTYDYFTNRLVNDEIQSTPKQDFIEEIQNKLINKEKLNIVSIRKIAESFGLVEIKDTTLQEYVEMAIINEAKKIANTNLLTTREKYQQIVELYETQPTISMRSSERIQNQQYSTPIPMSFIAGQFVRDIAPDTILEPSAGNGMMVFNVEEKNVIANEISKVRLENLKEQNFRQVTNQDGTLPFNIMVDGIVTNPPFGPAPKKDYLGYSIAGLDEQMVINALESMNDNGRASIVIGGHTSYNDNGTLKSQKSFLNYLYNYYNVVDIINVGGNLYQKQGTSYPTRMILIDGRKKPLRNQKENTIEFAPLKTDASAKVITSFQELYERVETSKNKKNENILPPKPSAIDNNREEGNTPKTDSGTRNPTNPNQLNLPGSTTKQKPDAGSNRPNGRKNGNSNQPAGFDLFTIGDGGSANINIRPEEQQNKAEGIAKDTEDGRADDSSRGASDVFAIELSNKPNELDGKQIEVNIDSEKTPYPKQSKSAEIGSVVPTNMAQALSNVLSQFGDIDAYVQNKLGYKTQEELFNALSAEQVDSVALAIYQIEKGKGLIIGDMTGVGKGRQAAAIIRYARLSGKKPIFFTEKPHLFSDLYRDLRDIGSSQLKPLIINQKSGDSDPSIIDENGKKIYSPLSAQEIKGVLSSGKVPNGYDYVLITYSQLNGNPKKGLSPKQQFFANIAQDNIVVFDESHNAGGAESNTGLMIREILPLTSGVTYLSGTFAKKPENMPLYALKTSMSDANMSQDELISAIQKGGVPLQEIMSRNLVEMGEMIRRERDFTGVTIDWETLDQNKKELEEIFNENIEIFNELIQFQREHIDPIIEGLDEELAEIQGGAAAKKGTKDFGVSNTPFASKTFNLVRQLLFSLKAEDVARETIKELKAGRKPVIAVGNTMETFIKDIGEGNTISNYNYSLTLKKGLDGLFRYTEKDFNGDAEQKTLSVNDLAEEGRQKYNELVDRINKVSANITISPIDIIKTRIKEAGFSVGELTGRSSELQINNDNTATVIKRQDKDKKKLARDFNNGEIDVLILNQSASTGISLHASKTFKDQRQRVMLSAQTQLDVNTEVQMRGRIDRTGQVLRGAYRYLISPIPAEQRLIMMFKAKLKSLDANTTSSQKSKTNEIEIVDFLNKYGDEVVLEYLKENREINDKLLGPLKFNDLADEKIDEIKSTEGDASKVSGRVALLSVKEQADFYNEVAERYTSYINYLNSNNSNDLEITTLPLNAETQSSVVVVQGNNNGSPFSEDSIRETVEVDVLKKPLKAKEISEEMEKTLDGKSNIEYKNANREKLKNYIEELDAKEEKNIRATADKKLQNYKTKIEKEADKQGLLGQDRQLFIEEKTNEYNRITNFKVNQAKSRNENKKNAVGSMFSSFNVGSSYLVPSTADVSLNTIYSQGIFLGYKMKERLSPSNITAVFATLDSRRKVEIPLSKIEYLNTIVAQTSRSDSRTLDANLDNWDSKRPVGTRRKAYIVTGNILQAFSVSQGQLVSYTTKDGQIKQGILLPENYKPEEQKMRVQIIKVIDSVRSGLPVVDSSGDISIQRRNGNYVLDVPLSKARGGKYFLDDKLRDMIVGRDFKQSGQGMVGVVTENRLEDVLGYLSSVHNISVETDTKPVAPNNVDAEVNKGIPMFGNLKDQQKALINAEVDRIAQKVKDFLPSTKDPDAKRQGIGQDELIDLIASTVKTLINASIDAKVAIEQVIASLTAKYGDLGITVDQVYDKYFAVKPSVVSPQENNSNLRPKAVLNRMAEGNDAIVRQAIEDYGMDLEYEQESQQLAKNNAKKFVAQVGLDNAVNALTENMLKGAEKAFVYGIVIDEIVKKIKQLDSTSEGTEEAKILSRQHLDLLNMIEDAFDKETRDNARFISALQEVYKSSNGRYNLNKEIEYYTANNNGEISDEQLQELVDANAKIKELEEKYNALTEEKEKIDAQIAVDNIVDAISRKAKRDFRKPITNKRRAKELADRLRSFKIHKNTNTNVATPLSLAFDGAIEIIAASIESGGALMNHIKKGVDYIKKQKLSQDEENMLIDDIINAFNEDNETKPLGVGADGRLKIPNSVIYDYVQGGITDIDELAEKILNDFLEMDYDLDITLREVRDAITKYGQQINQTQDDILLKIGEMNRIGRLISAIEDAEAGQRPSRTGLLRPKKEIDERRLMTKLKELLRDIPMDNADLDRKWKTALDTIKTRLANEIENLDRQIDLGERRKAEKVAVVYDQEANDLKAERDAKRKILDDLVGKPELTEQQRITKTESALDTQIKNLRKEIAENDLSYKTKKDPLVSNKITELKAELKALRDTKQLLREQSGIVEKRMLDMAKKTKARLIKNYKEKIANRDFAKKEVKRRPIDDELLKLDIELAEQRNRFLAGRYVLDLKNRSKSAKALDAIQKTIGVTRKFKATLEFSTVLVQHGFLSVKYLVTKPLVFAEGLKRIFLAFTTPSKYTEYENQLKNSPNYALMIKTKAGLTETDYKAEAVEEGFEGDITDNLWTFIGNKLDKVNSKKALTLTGIARKLIGKPIREQDMKSTGEKFKDSAFWKMFERGSVAYGNFIKETEFNEGVRLLQNAGYDPINDLKQYEKVASYVRTFSGRARLGKLEMMSAYTSMFIFSLKNAVATFQQINPIFYATLGDGTGKPTVAQKMAVKTFLTGVSSILGFSFAFVAMSNLLRGDDEDEWEIETDPNSTNFLNIMHGKVNYDLWHGTNKYVTLFSRIITGEYKNAKGEVKKYGEGYKSETRQDAISKFATNKLSPSAGFGWKMIGTNTEVVNGVSYRVDPYGNVVTEQDLFDLFVPIYYNAVKEVVKEDPNMFDEFLILGGLYGVGIQPPFKQDNKVPKEVSGDIRFE